MALSTPALITLVVGLAAAVLLAWSETCSQRRTPVPRPFDNDSDDDCPPMTEQD